jgi:hypothetical protein
MDPQPAGAQAELAPLGFQFPQNLTVDQVYILHVRCQHNSDEIALFDTVIRLTKDLIANLRNTPESTEAIRQIPVYLHKLHAQEMYREGLLRNRNFYFSQIGPQPASRAELIIDSPLTTSASEASSFMTGSPLEASLNPWNQFQDFIFSGSLGHILWIMIGVFLIILIKEIFFKRDPKGVSAKGF